MTTYVYETLPKKPGQKPKYYEIKQNMSDAPLKQHPETGEPIRRVVLGGYGVLNSKGSESSPASGGGACCGPSCGCG